MGSCPICGGAIVRPGHQAHMECEDCGAEYNAAGDNLTTIDDYVDIYQEIGGEG